jgi:hypothetical protein
MNYFYTSNFYAANFYASNYYGPDGDADTGTQILYKCLYLGLYANIYVKPQY